jgi:chemosensory pili system protein ChpA (sensor histidine kinase/response regulator)
MNAATEFDLGPLTWVKGEIDLALERAAEALGQHELSGDATQLRFCRTHVHQVHGALSIVGLDGVTQVTESLEALLGALEERRVQPTAENLTTLTQAMAALRKYLDDLLAGEPNQPLRLFPVYSALAVARGLPACSQADLFFPDLSLRPPRRAVPVAPLSPDQLHTLLKSERGRFQKGLLAWLRHTSEPHAALEPMRTALDNIESTQESPAARSFWWVALAFVESLFDHQGEPDVESRQLLARIDTQIRRLLEGSLNVAERLMRDVLCAVAHAPANTSMLVAEVQSVFDLRSLIPAEPLEHETNLPQEVSLRRLRDTLTATEDAWNKFCTGSASALQAFELQAQTCAELTNEIGNTDLKRLGQSFGALAHWLVEDPKRHNDSVAMEVATAILLLQNAQENFRRLGMDFAQQVDLMVARLYACIAGKPAGGNDELPLLDEMTRRAQERLLVGQVAREIQNNLAQVEQALDAFFRNPEKGHDLTPLDAPVKQIAGALAMLGHFSAVSMLQDCGARIQQFATPGYAPVAEDFESVAQQLSLLGFFIDSLQHGETDFDAFCRRLQGAEQAATEDHAEVEAQAAPSVEAQVEQNKQETQTLFDAFREAPDDSRIRAELKDNLQSLQKDAGLLANPELGDTAKVVLSALESGEAFQPEIAAAVSSLIQPATEAPAPSAATLELAQSSHEEIDAELLEIFLEEANEVLATIGEQSAQLAADGRNTDALTTIRRSAHTLKGSGRMVGLVDLGEAAWELEQTLNMWLRQDMSVTPDLLTLISDAHQLFSRWVVALEQRTGQTPDPSQLVALAELLRGESRPAIDTVSVEITPAQSVELPVAEEGESPSVVLDLPVHPGWADDAAKPPAADAGAELIEALPFEAPAEYAGEPSATEVQGFAAEGGDMANMFADLSVSEETPVVQPFEFAEGVPAEPVATPAPTLYDIFREEARGHLENLLAGYGELEANPGLPTSFEMTRAAHTLGGIAATVGLMPLNHLAIALEHALMRRDSCGRPDSIGGLETVRQAIITLEQMFEALARQEAPNEQAQLIAALEDVFLVEAQAEAPVVEVPAPLAEEIVSQCEPEILPVAEAVTPAVAMPGTRLQDDLDEQLLPIFLEEAQDQLRELTVQMRLWRGDPASDAQPHAIARLLHTFKGNARMAGAMNLGEFTHLLESRVEDVLRAGAATPAFIDEIEGGCDTLAQATERLRHGESAIIDPASLTPGQGGSTAVSTIAVATDADHDHDIETGAQRASLRVRADLIDRLVNEAGELSIARSRIEGEMRSLKGSLLDLTENVIRLRRQLREIEIQAEGQIQARVAQAHDGQADFDPLELDRFTRFQELTRFMAESVNDVATVQQNLLKNLDDANAAIVAQARLNRGLQQELMGVRMMPFASQAERLFRIVRQTSKELGKRANFDIVGGQVELDRSVLDKMMAPLEHMLRNAVAHGIETRTERVEVGKPEIGEITVALAHEGNEIILSMADDGRGLDRERIRARAQEMGLIEPGMEPDDAMLYDFIFRPGFSTAGEVSQLAGRGVGMDVVKTEVSELGGRIEILSQSGHGTTFRLYLPLTLAVTQTLLLRVGSNIYAVPSTMIEQVLELKEEPLAEVRRQGEVEWQGNAYPFHYLPHLLGDAAAAPEAQRRYWILLLRSGSQRVAVQVDELRGNQEVVVKNIGAQLSRVVGIAGATVLGDGQVVLILNPVALASRTPVVSIQSTVPVSAAPAEMAVAALPTVMVVDDSLTVRKITSRLLTREGYQVVLAKDGVDALEQLLEVMPDVVLSDIEMPRMDGFDLVRNIRADKRLGALPVIMITSRTAEKHRNYALEIGASEYLGKPYDEDQLLSLIAGYIRAKKAS